MSIATANTLITGQSITDALDALADHVALDEEDDYTVGVFRFNYALTRLTMNGTAPVTGAIINRAAAEALDTATYGEPYPGNVAGVIRARDTAKAIFAFLSVA